MTRRAMLSAYIHAQRPGAILSACGRRLSATLRWSHEREQVTCSVCRYALGIAATSREEALLQSIFGDGPERLRRP